MRSLTAHLRQADDHGRLPFHPGCPICREQRLTGAVSSEGVISRRAQAVFAAGVLALSGATPAAALAAEPDQQQDGTAAPQAGAGGDPATSPDFDPGGDSTDLPYDAAPTPQISEPADPGNPDTGALDEDPSTDPSAPVADPGDGGDQPSQQPYVAPRADSPSPGVASPAQPANPPTPTPTPDATTPTSPTNTPAVPAPEASPVALRGKPQIAAIKSQRHTHTRRSPELGRGPVEITAHVSPSASAPSAATPAAAPTVAGVPVRGHRARPDDRAHVVLPGESLWSIASDVLGGDPAPAAIAREVHRLWALNKDRIGTGDPDLVMVGTKLKLR